MIDLEKSHSALRELAALGEFINVRSTVLASLIDEIERLRNEKENTRRQFVAAIKIALQDERGDGLQFLRDWSEGEPNAMWEADQLVKKDATL